MSAAICELFGAVLKETATGKKVPHVQPKGMFDQIVATVTKGIGATVSQGFSPLGAAALVQNQMIWGKLSEISAMLGFLQSLQIASLAVSCLGLGISLANIVVLQKGFKRIEQHLDRLPGETERVREGRNNSKPFTKAPKRRCCSCRQRTERFRTVSLTTEPLLPRSPPAAIDHCQ